MFSVQHVAHQWSLRRFVIRTSYCEFDKFDKIGGIIHGQYDATHALRSQDHRPACQYPTARAILTGADST
jgi:hypothetical protein